MDIFIQSIFERVREKVNFIEFQKFNESVNASLIGLEFYEMLRDPFEKVLGRKAKYFEQEEVNSDDSEIYSKTMSTLMSMVND